MVADGAEQQTAQGLDQAVLERQAEEELGELAARWVALLPEDSRLRQELNRLLVLAPGRRQAA